MTDKGSPNPLNKWYYRWPWTRVAMLAYCIGSIFVGVLGFTDSPSPSIQSQLGTWAVWLYSGIMIVSGAIGALGLFRSLQATVVSVWALAAASLFHGLAVWGAGNPQTGLRLAVAPIMMVPLVWAWKQWLVLVKHVQHLDTPGFPWRRH